MGAANATLAASDLCPERSYGYAWQLKRTAKYAKRIGNACPLPGPRCGGSWHGWAICKHGKADRPIHGAPHLHQWLIAGDQLGLVDFDRFGLGDPELDVATFLAEADFEDSFDGLGEAYRTGFENALPLDNRLVGVYRLQKHVAKALRLLGAIRLDAEDRALQVIEQAASKAERLP